MLSILENLIRCTDYIDIPNESFYKPKELAKEILEAIEKAGMLPPETIRYIDQDNGNTLVSSECLWEPEDV
jgi:hypothetical protein